MKTINRNEIQQLFPPHIYERGLIYYNEKRVNGLSYNKHEQTWFAEVRGTQKYYVEIDLAKLANGKIRTYCECPAFDTYHTCKHLVAVMLLIAEQQPEKIWNSKDTQQFIEKLLLSEHHTTSFHSNKLPMKVEYYLKLDDTNKIWLELKTGLDHCYVIRNVRDFLDNVLADNGHFFTKKFSFDPNEHYFLQQDREIMEQLQSFIQTGDLFTDRSYTVENAYDRREFLIPPLTFKTLLERVTRRMLLVETGKEFFKEVQIVEDEMPFSFSVAPDTSEQLMLKINELKDSHYYPEYKMIFSDGTFFFPTENQLRIITQIKRFGETNKGLPIASESVDTFFSEALPVLKQASPVEIEEEITNEIVEHPLRAKLHLEEKNNTIAGKLTYHYGKYVIDPFSKNNEQEVIIIRDVHQEQYIMGLVEQSNFYYNGKELYIKMENDEEIYYFLYTILPTLEQYVELFLTADIKRLIIENEPIPTATVSVQESSNLLEIGFDISGVDEEEVHGIINAVIEKKRYYRLNSGALFSLDNEEYVSMRKMFDDLQVEKSDLEQGNIVLPAYRGLQVEEFQRTDVSYHSSFEKLLSRLKSPEKQVYELPKNLQANLRNYQETGFQWFKSLSAYQLGGILADDMGLGKTVQTIAYVLSEPSDHPHLVVVPSSVIYNWRNECRRFAPDLKVAVISGSPEERVKLIEKAKDVDIWITSYGTIRQDIKLYKELTFQTLILDEAQYIKNYVTKTSRAIREIVAKRRFALSGTPIENSLDELWSIFHVILPGFLPSLAEFRKMDREKIASLTKPFILRRVKTDVLKELPEKIESVHISGLTQDQKELYVGYLQQLQAETSASIADNQFQQNRMKILAGLTRLRQLCCHPSLFIENYTGRSGKLDELIEMVQTMVESGKRMLIFSQFTSMHQLIMKALDEINVDYFYLHGQTSAKDRVEMSEAFNNGEKSVFLISLRAGGTGLNLTGADTVILYDLWWNPAVEDQAAGRAHRFGQKNVVQVIRLITEGTIEEKIYELQQKKRELIDQVIQPGETMLSSLSEEDVRRLLSI
ncbi:MAG TPA: DEAD/DEAH box helicase [Pseudogracilibacillus sp.]|nr:DEAD/DEAH box helicase [Pseudogracilibacillus sp.]